MDTISHALWGYGFFGRNRFPWLAAFFGAMPDLFSFGIWFVLRILTNQITFQKPNLYEIPSWVVFNYNATHSLLISCGVVLLIVLCQKQLAFSLLAWPLHILLDIPFHSKEFFATKMFWPITNFSFDGIPWVSFWVWIPNCIGLIILFLYNYFQKKKSSNIDKI